MIYDPCCVVFETISFLIGLIGGRPMYVASDYVAIKLNRTDSCSIQRYGVITANFHVVLEITVRTSSCVVPTLMVCLAHITLRAFQLCCKGLQRVVINKKFSLSFSFFIF